MLQRGPRGWFTLPEAAVQTAAIAAMSGTTPPPPLKDLVPKIAPRPVFFIYAGHGAGGEEFNPDLYQAAGAPKALWKIPEANHVGGFQVRPHEYELRVVGFFNRALHPADRVSLSRTRVGRAQASTLSRAGVWISL